MSAFILDTCVLSELSKPRSARPVMDWLDSNFSRSILTSPVLMELVSGAEGARNATQRARFGDAVQRIVDRFPPERRAVFDEAAARAAGEAMAKAKLSGRPISAVDAQIIGLAHTLNAAIVTRDADFANRGVEIVNPWIES